MDRLVQLFVFAVVEGAGGQSPDCFAASYERRFRASALRLRNGHDVADLGGRNNTSRGLLDRWAFSRAGRLLFIRRLCKMSAHEFRLAFICRIYLADSTDRCNGHCGQLARYVASSDISTT
jgi:hypothetical protein